MSFFLLEEEEQATLAEALAFIDTFPPEAGDTDTSDHSLYVEVRLPPKTSEALVVTPTAASRTTSAAAFAHGSPLGGSTSGADSSGGDADDEEQQKKLRARAANTRAVHRYRKRNKNEIIDLREQAQQLEAQLAQLRARDSGGANKVPKRAIYSSAGASKLLQLQASFAGIGDAVAEYRKLQQSEALNRRLKEALEKQRKVSVTLEEVFKKQIQKTDLSFVLDVEKKLMPNAVHKEIYEGRNNARIFTDLFHYLHDEVYKSTPSVLQLFSRCDVDAVFNNTLYKQDSKVGKTFEFTSNTPLAYSVEQLDAKLWTFLTFPASSSESVEDPFFNVYTDGNIETQRLFTMSFDSLLGGSMRVDGVSAIRKFIEPHRIVLTFSSLLTPTGSGLLFRENAWLILSDAQVSGCTSSPTLFQTVYRLQADHETSTKAISPELAKVHSTVLNQQGDKMRAFQVMIQNRLLNRFDEIPDGGILSSCFDQISCCS